MKDGLYTEYYVNGNKKYEGYYKDGRRHRQDGAAWIWYHKNGYKWFEGYYKDGKWHREDGPAIVGYDENGKIKEQRWFKDGGRLDVIPKSMLEAYMKTNDLKLVDLLTSNNEIVRNSAEIYDWKKIV